ncbi:hypothetical protein Tco_0801264 [Tanacetum coccineum]|uniref:Zinc finger, CCHC-type n=1 Tax=Tanacetum coccineum TaxID=301880 RepID=A0ABQ4ZYC8_9ASTR
MFQQHQGESFSEAWTRFKDLLQKVPHHGIDLWLQVQIFYDHVTPATRRTIDQSADGKLHDRNAKESWALLEDLALYDNKSLNDPRDFAKSVKAISLPQDVPSTSSPMHDGSSHCSYATYSSEQDHFFICSGPHDTQYYMKDPKQAFVKYVSSCTDKAGGLVSNFMASQDARFSKFEADFKQQQREMTNNIDIVLKAITDRMAGDSSVIHSINTITIHQSKDELKREGNPEDSNAAERKEEQRCTPQPELKEPTDIKKIRPSRNDKEREIKWLDVEEPLDLVDTSEESIYKSLIKEMPKCSLNYDFRIKKGNMSYIMDFTILKNIETNIDPSLSHIVFGRPFVEIACLAINRKHGLMTFTDETKEITFKTPYKDPERNELSSEGHDLLSSRIILNEDDYDRGCRKPTDLEDGFYRDTIKLGPEYKYDENVCRAIRSLIAMKAKRNKGKVM